MGWLMAPDSGSSSTNQLKLHRGSTATWCLKAAVTMVAVVVAVAAE